VDSLDLTGDAARNRKRFTYWADPRYEYNQIVGWVRLTVTGRGGFHGATLKGYYSRRDRERIAQNCRAPFEGSCKFTEFYLHRENSRRKSSRRFARRFRSSRPGGALPQDVTLISKSSTRWRLGSIGTHYLS
jgi:hypothetical protein